MKGRLFWYYAIVLPLIAYCLLNVYYFLTFKSVLGNKHHFEHCNIIQYDAASNSSRAAEETVTILKVDHGLKIVEAETMMGAIYGLGFIHAKDRLWQMHFYRMLVRGRLAELVGPSGVSIDKYLRTIGLPRAARITWD
jgi:acyl-homoserine lactone acylase PvdQ